MPTLTLTLTAEEQLKCYLLTVGPGEELYLWFGHTGIIIEEEDGNSKFYDFGNFSFKSDHFYRNFAMGRLIYLKIGVSAPAYLNYIVRENRDVTLQQLNISQENIRKMKAVLEQNILPENNTYLYHHYLDNCSTRPRDIINTALDGQLKQASDQPADASFRSSFRRYTSHSFFPDWLLSLLQGRTIDTPVKKWDTMFLPDELMKQLDDLQVLTDGVPGPAVLQKKILAEDPEHRVIPDTAPASAGPALLYGLMAGLILLFLQRISLYRDGKAGRTAAVFLMILLTALSLFALLFYFISFFTDHLVARQNINVLVINPSFILAGILVIKKSGNKLIRFWQFQGGLWVLMLVLNLLFFHQGNLRTSLFFLPLILCQLTLGRKSLKTALIG